MEASIDEKKNKPYLKPTKVDFEPKNKTKGKSGTVKRFHIKRTVQEEQKWVSSYSYYLDCLYLFFIKFYFRLTFDF